MRSIKYYSLIGWNKSIHNVLFHRSLTKATLKFIDDIGFPEQVLNAIFLHIQMELSKILTINESKKTETNRAISKIWDAVKA